MVRPSRIARKARRTHQQQQEALQKQKLPSCEGCGLCSATKAIETGKARKYPTPLDQQQAHQETARKIRQRLKSKIFMGDVILDTREMAFAIAASETNFGFAENRHAYWTDASRLPNGGCGIGVVYATSAETWMERAWSIRGKVISGGEKSYTLEIYAIAKTIEIAWERCCDLDVGKRPSSVCIYSDCESALWHFLKWRKNLDRLKKVPRGVELVGPGVIAAEKLSELNVELQLRHVPGHAGIRGNVRADRAPKRGAEERRPRGKNLMTECTSWERHRREFEY